jgi:hypothetical protein
MIRAIDRLRADGIMQVHICLRLVSHRWVGSRVCNLERIRDDFGNVIL